MSDCSPERAAQIVATLNAYFGCDTWQDIILRLDEYDEVATDDLDKGTNDVFALRGGIVIRFNHPHQRWSAEVSQGDDEWETEKVSENYEPVPGWMATRTFWIAYTPYVLGKYGQQHQRIDRAAARGGTEAEAIANARRKYPDMRGAPN